MFYVVTNQNGGTKFIITMFGLNVKN